MANRWSNRTVLQAVTRRAADLAQSRGVILNFSITTNGTLLTEADAAFFEEFGFAVTVSLDGPAEVHDALRPYKSGRGSFDRVMANVRPLLASQRQMQVSARITVTPRNLALRDTLDQFLAEGFHSVGFTPLLRSPNGSDEMQADTLEVMLGEMIDCGREFERRSLAGERYAFANMVNAMKEIERGTHRPYPCGAGAGYLGVSADGDLAACHRFVGDDDGVMGSLVDGVDRRRQSGLAGRAACASTGTVSVLLGALSVRGRMPPRSDSSRAAGVRLHPWLAALLPQGLSPVVGPNGSSAIRRAVGSSSFERKSSMLTTADICIIGGGPAGSALGARLAQFGLSVWLVERATFPRRHLGESLSPGVIPLLASIGAGPAIEKAAYPRVRKVSVRWEEEREREDPQGGGCWSIGDTLIACSWSMPATAECAPCNPRR